MASQDIPSYTLRRMVEQQILSGGRQKLPMRGPDLARFLDGRRIQSGSLAHLNAYSPAHWRPRGPEVEDVAEFERAVSDVVAGLGESAVVSYQAVATKAGYPTRARAVAQFLAHGRKGLPWWRVVRADGYLSNPEFEAQARALWLEGIVVDGRRIRERLLGSGPLSAEAEGRAHEEAEAEV